MQSRRFRLRDFWSGWRGPRGSLISAPAGPSPHRLFGGAWLTPQILSDDALRTFQTSVQRFKDATRKAKVDVLLQNHMLMDPIQPKLDALAARRKGDANPFVLDRAEYQKFLDVMEGCTAVNLARRKVS